MILYIIKEIFRGENNRNNIIGFIFSIMFIAVIVRLFNLQIINGEYYEENYVQKSVKTVTIPAARGNIYDADGNILAYNELVKNITIADVDAYKQNNRDINRRESDRRQLQVFIQQRSKYSIGNNRDYQRYSGFNLT